MLHHRLARRRVWSANIKVQPCPSHALTLAKSSSHTNFARASPIGSSRDSGDRQRRIVLRSMRPRLPALIWVNVSSRAKSRLRGPSSSSARGGTWRPICSRTKALNHSRSARASSAALSSSPRPARARNASKTSLDTRRAWTSQSSRPSPFSSQSMGVSIGVAIEFRKSRPSESAMNIAGGLFGTIDRSNHGKVDSLTCYAPVDKLSSASYNLTTGSKEVTHRCPRKRALAACGTIVALNFKPRGRSCLNPNNLTFSSLAVERRAS